jgi:hypothetical protein
VKNAEEEGKVAKKPESAGDWEDGGGEREQPD